MNRHLAEQASDRIHRADTVRMGTVIGGGDRGASLVEYVLLVGLIFLVCLASVTGFGDGVSGSVDSSASRVVTAGGQSYGG